MDSCKCNHDEDSTTFYGTTSWFKYEELIDDWLDLTVLEAEKRGPALKNRLVGDAEMYKGLPHRESLRAANGVKYLRDTLRPHFIKRTQSVFLWRFYQFIRSRRENIEMVKWIMSTTSEQVTTHERLFPISDNLATLMFIVASDLSEAQRERLTSSLSLKGVNVTAYTFEAVRTVFVELFCTPKSSMDNPSLRMNRHGGSTNRTIIVEN